MENFNDTPSVEELDDAAQECLTQDFTDPYGLWEHICQLFKQSPAEDLTQDQRIQLVQYLQKRYNARYLNTAISHGEQCIWRPKNPMNQKLRLDHFAHRCFSPFCPRCWWMTQQRCLRTINSEAPKYPVLYRFETTELPIDRPIDERVWKRLLGRDTSYRLIAWALALTQDESQHDQAQPDERHISIGGNAYPVQVRVVAIVGAMKEIRERGPMVRRWGPAPADSVHGLSKKRPWTLRRDTCIRDDSGAFICDIIRTPLYDTIEALEKWLEAIGHPSLVDGHNSFEQAIVWSKSHGTTFGCAGHREKK